MVDDSKKLVLIPTPATETALASLQQLAGEASEYVAQSKAPNTRKAYRADWQAFVSWCETHGLSPMPARPEAVSTYAAHMAKEGLKVSTISRALAALSQAHQMAGHESPVRSALVRETLRGIRRTLGAAPSRKAPISLEELRGMVELVPNNTVGMRDRALLLVGFTGAFRRSELAELEVRDLEFSERGVVVTLRHSKTDQEGKGTFKAIPYANDSEMCPVKALTEWLTILKIESGPVFPTVDRWGHVAIGQHMSHYGVALAVKRYARKLGLDVKRFAGHSLRAGFATAATLAGRDESDIMRQTGHRSVAVFRDYVRIADVWRKNAAKGLL